MMDKSWINALLNCLSVRQMDIECIESELNLGREIGIAGLYLETLSTC